MSRTAGSDAAEGLLQARPKAWPVDGPWGLTGGLDESSLSGVASHSAVGLGKVREEEIGGSKQRQCLEKSQQKEADECREEWCVQDVFQMRKQQQAS